MPSPWRSRLFVATLLAIAALPSRSFAIGEVITDIRVQNNARTLEETVRSVAGIDIGELLEADTLDRVRERLNTSGLFADVNVFWQPYRDGVRVFIVIKDKFPWAPVPTFSYSPGNTSVGLLIGHGNLFGRGKRGIIGGRYSTVDSGALVAYDDPALFGSWGFFTLKGRFQDQVLPEFGNLPDLPVIPVRETKLRSFGGDINLGVAWFRKVRTSVGWSWDKTEVRGVKINSDKIPDVPMDLPAPGIGARRGVAVANLTFDFRAREHAVMYGNALAFNFDYAAPRFGSDDFIEYWKAAAQYEQGLRFWRKHNVIVRAAAFIGNNLPFWQENASSGTSLRGFVYHQFIGDTQLRTQVEYHFPLFSYKALDVRGVVFNDGSAIWFRKLPPITADGLAYETRADGRQFLPPNLLIQGFDAKRDIHTGVGAGLRFFLRSVAVPLVGVDVGHGIDTGTVRIVLVIGA